MLKYKINDSNNNPDKIGDVVDVSKVESKKSGGRKPAKAPTWFITFETNLNNRLDKMDSRFINLVKVNKLKE